MRGMCRGEMDRHVVGPESFWGPSWHMHACRQTVQFGSNEELRRSLLFSVMLLIGKDALLHKPD